MSSDAALADCRLMVATPIYDGAQGSYVRAALDLALRAQAAGIAVRFEFILYQPAIGRARDLLTAMFLALLVPQCVSRLHVLVALFTTTLSISLKAAGMTQWNIAVATVLGASLGTWLLVRKAQHEGTPIDLADQQNKDADSRDISNMATPRTEEAES